MAHNPSTGEPKSPRVRDLPYFISNFSDIEEVVRYLKPSIDKDGAFIIRNSVTNQKKTTVSVCHQKGIRHISLLKRNGKYCLSERRWFDSVTELVEYYKKHDVPNKEQVSGVRLKDPIIPQPEHDYVNNHGRELDPQDAVRPPHLFIDHVDGAPSEAAPAPPFVLRSPSPNHSRGRVPPEYPRLSPLPSPTSPTAAQGHVPSPLTPEAMLMVQRPPPPPPSFSPEVQEEIDRIRDSPLYIERQYTDVRDIDMDLSSHLISQLMTKERCECGLYMHEAQLPGGWTVHLVNDQNPNTPKIFYVSPDHTSAWNLPNEVKALLNGQQKRFLQSIGGPKIQ